MKLHEIFNIDIIWEGEIGGEEYTFQVNVINEKARAGFAKRGGIVRRGGAKKTLGFLKNPVLLGLASGYAIDALSTYNKNKRKTTTFFAKNMDEKKMYNEIVATLMRTGNYRKVREKSISGGYIWELKRN